MHGREWMSALDSVPRRRLVPLPTPLHPAPRFSEAVGVEVWVKRDDVGPVGMAGNKIRKLEYLIADALRLGADTLVTTGALQSNSARASAFAAAAAGMRSILVLGGDADGQPSGNLLLDMVVGADVRFPGDVEWAELDRLVDDAADELRQGGGIPYAAPVGCSTPLGVLGFVEAYRELLVQLDAYGLDPGVLIHTTTSGGTHAGLALGHLLSGRGPEVLGISAGRLQDDPEMHHAELVAASAHLLEVEVCPDEVPARIDFDHIGPGYGEATVDVYDAIAILARTEGIVCDPVYSGKGLAGLVAHARSGDLTDPVVFWHTGGYHALFDPAIGGPLLEALR